MNEIIPVPETGLVVSGGGVEILVNGFFGLIVDFGEDLFLRDTLYDSQVDLAVLHVNLVLGDVGSEDSVLHYLFLLYLVLDQSVCGNWHFHVLRWDYY